MIFTFPHFTDVQFQKIEDKYCSYTVPDTGSFSNITSAEERCRRDSYCKGVWDQGCDESQDDVYLCMVGHEYIDYKGDCIYDKKVEF